MTEYDPEAPHGRDANGDPLEPYGRTVEGRIKKAPGRPVGGGGTRPRARAPRIRNRSAAAPKGPTPKQRDAQRKETLIALGDMFVVSPLVGLSVSPPIKKWIGQAQADALGGDAVITTHFLPSVADGLILLSQTKPKVLSWLDGVEDKAPYLVLMSTGIQLAKMIAENHMRPNPELNASGRTMMAIRAQQMAAEIHAQAEAMGIPTEVPIPESEAA